MKVKIRVGHTPDADDAFMFYAIEKGLISTGDFVIEHIIEDIESLNKKALNHELEITAISAHAYAYLENYVILNSGGSFGLNYGPIIITKDKTMDKISQGIIGIPGKLTSAFLLLSIAIGKLNYREMLFSDIPNEVLKGRIDYGLVIHESQITYKVLGLKNLFDLGKWWHQTTSGLPVPLGINVASSEHLTNKQIVEFDKILQRSIKYSLDNTYDAINYSQKYGRGTSSQTLEEFVKMYVNDVTYEMKEKGKQALEKLFSMAKEKDIINKNLDLVYSY